MRAAARLGWGFVPCHDMVAWLILRGTRRSSQHAHKLAIGFGNVLPGEGSQPGERGGGGRGGNTCASTEGVGTGHESMMRLDFPEGEAVSWESWRRAMPCKRAGSAPGFSP